MDSIGKVTGNIIINTGENTKEIKKTPEREAQTLKNSSPIISDKADINSSTQSEPANIKDVQTKLATASQEAEKTSKTAEAKSEFISAHVNGWVGSHSANLSIDQSDNDVNVNGWVGSGSVSVNEWKNGDSSSINGHINEPFGEYKNVNLHSFGSDGNRNINGWIGRDNVFLNESSFSGGIRHISGRVGDRDVDIRVENQNGMININGYVRDTNTHQFNRVWVSGNQNPPEPPVSYLGIIPALIISTGEKGNIVNS